jgi:hypothetical protein
MDVELSAASFPPQVQVKVELSVTGQINITAQTAQRKVSKLMLDQVGNLLYGETPSFVAGQRLVWRVPVWLSTPVTGPLGQVGSIDVDAETGEILYSQQLLEDIGENGDRLARRSIPTAS